MEELKHLYKIGPRGGVKKVGSGPCNCDMVAILGYEPDEKEKGRLFYGSGTNEKERKKNAYEGFVFQFRF